MEGTLQTLCHLRMAAVIGQRTGKLVGPGLAALLLTHLTELSDIGRHVAHVVQSEADHIRYIGQGTLTGGVVETLHTDITVDHRHEWQTTAHECHGTGGLLAVVVHLIVESIEGEDRLG